MLLTGIESKHCTTVDWDQQHGVFYPPEIYSLKLFSRSLWRPEDTGGALLYSLILLLCTLVLLRRSFTDGG